MFPGRHVRHPYILCTLAYIRSVVMKSSLRTIPSPHSALSLGRIARSVYIIGILTHMHHSDLVSVECIQPRARYCAMRAWSGRRVGYLGSSVRLTIVNCLSGWRCNSSITFATLKCEHYVLWGTVSRWRMSFPPVTRAMSFLSARTGSSRRTVARCSIPPPDIQSTSAGGRLARRA